MKRFPLAVAAIVVFLGAFSCTDEEGTRHALRVAGNKNVEVTGYDWWTCGESDTCTGFRAVAPSGEPVRGAVDCGFWSCGKGCTVRIK